MKLIKDGRLFGKLNLIDLVVILLIVAVAAAVIIKRGAVTEVDPLADAEQKSLKCKVICRMVSNEMLHDFEKSAENKEQLMAGGEMVENCRIVNVEKAPYLESYVDGDGVLQHAESTQFCNVTFTIEGTAPYQDNAFHVGSQEVRTGKSHIVKTRTIEITGNVIELEGIDG